MQTKTVIQLLSDQVINKIAAGEVVERPASVMKELFENAIDAKATQIDVEIIRGGRQLIAITDNGSGMNRDQALLSIERHATSKIRSEADIEQIATLGFRGEALSSISSVSRFTLITRLKEELSGTEIQIAGGKVLSVEEIGAPVGTRIEVRNLFFNVPARRKFLRAEQTELAHIRQLFLVHALAHPTIGMSLKIDERLIYQLPCDGTIKDRIGELYPAGFLEQLLPIQFNTDEYRLTGFAGLPQTGRKNRQDQYIFINGRPAAAPVVYHALNEAYYSLIQKGNYPAVFLFIEMDPSLVDVNVHPTKKEVRFRRPNQLRDAIILALKKALTVENIETTIELPLPKATCAAPPKIETQHKMQEILVRPDHILNNNSVPKNTPVPVSETQQAPVVNAAPESPSSSPWGWCRIIGQMGDGYVVLETKEGFVLMETRAAHERVLFEKFMKAARQHAIKQQGLLVPETIEMLPSDALILRENLSILSELGFGIADFGSDSFLVDSLPVYIQNGSVETMLVEIVRSLEKIGKNRVAREMIQEQIAQTACQTAVRFKEKLSEKEIEKLVSDLAKTEMPYTSPRGRPTLVFTSFTELDRKFNRG